MTLLSTQIGSLPRQVYGHLLSQQLGDFAKSIRTQSELISTEGGRVVHAFGVIPQSPKRTVLIHSGAGHSFAEDCLWIADMVKQDSAVIDIEPYSHGPYSSPYPPTGRVQDMITARHHVNTHGLIPFFLYNPQLQNRPIHELGYSMGGGTVVNGLMNGDNRVHLSERKAISINSVTLIAPRLELSRSSYRPWLRSLVAPVLGAMNFISFGGLERLRQTFYWAGYPRKIIPTRYGVGPETEEGQWMAETAAMNLRPRSLPWPVVVNSFRHDRAVRRRIRDKKYQELPRSLWVLSPQDHEVESRTVAQLACELSGDMILGIKLHNPFWDADRTAFLSAVHAFMDGNTDIPHLKPLTPASINAILE